MPSAFTPCSNPGAPPPGTNNIVVTWTRTGDVSFDESVTSTYYPGLLSGIAGAGGYVIAVKFYDASNNLIPGLDTCGNPIAPPPPPGGGGGGGGGAPPDAGGDELTVSFGELFIELRTLIDAIAKLTTSQPKPIDYTQCCHAIAVAIETLAKVVAKIEVAITAPGAELPGPIDLSAVVFELTCVCAKLTAISTSSATVATELAPGLKSIADALNNATGPNLDDLKKAILHAGEAQEIPAHIKQIAVELGVITAEDAQVAGDPMYAPIKSAAELRALAKIFGKEKELDGWLKTHVGTLLSNWLPAFLDWFIADAAKQVRKAHDSGIANSPEWRALGNDLLTLFQGLFGGFGKFAVDTLIKDISPAGDVHSAQGVDNFSTMIANASALAGAAWSAATVGGIALGEHSKHLNYFAALFAMGAGYDAIAEGALGAFIHPTVVNPSRQHWNKLYRSHIPDDNAAASMFARGLLDAGLFREAVAAAGLRSDFEEAHEKSAYSGLNARMLLRLAGTGLFTDADVADELTFGGMRQSSQHRLIAAAAFLGTEPQRHKFESALERIYAAGLISDSNFVEGVKSAEHNTDRYDLILRAVQLEKQIALAKEYEAAYSREFLNGLLDAPAYQSALEALGMQPPDVAARMFRDDSHMLVTQTLGAERQARAIQRATASSERKAAIEAFRTGSTDPAGLAASLTLTGLSAAQVAAEVGYQILARSGVLRWIYGRQLPPQEATLLRQQIADLTRQREIEMLTDAQYVAQLTSLSIPPRYIQALRAGANAHISPKTQAILTPPI